MDNDLDLQLDKAWNSTCRVLFGRELGRLADYREWLSACQPKKARRKSALSGKDVTVAYDAFPKGARFLSSGELAQNKEYSLSINQLKDVDSILSALSEKAEFAGNRHLGNCAHVESSDIVLDSQYVRNSTNIEESQYVDSSFMVRKGSKYIFGCGALGNGEFLIRVTDSYGQKRSFESSIIGTSSDCYFCHNVLGCHDMVFSFGQRNKSYCICNVQLGREKYLAVKAKILGEVADMLQKEKSFPALAELVPSAAAIPDAKLGPGPGKSLQNMAAIEKGFASTYGILVKKPASSIRDYEKWLARGTVAVSAVKTPFGNETYVPDGLPVLGNFPKGRIVTASEAMELGKLCAQEADFLDLGTITDSLGKFAFFTPELCDGQNSNLIAFPHAFNVVNGYRGFDSVYSEHVALSSMALNSKYVYGCHRTLESQFSLKCFNSLNLNRCFELDSCDKCADAYFCHNSEALTDCMFCFNLKGRRYNIGNTQLDKEKYASIKNGVLEQVGGELERKKSLSLSIFGIGAKA
jgi:hypothetical protein